MTDKTRYCHPCFPQLEMDKHVARCKHDPQWSWLIDAIIGANKPDQWQKWECTVRNGVATVTLVGSRTPLEVYFVEGDSQCGLSDGHLVVEVRKLKGKIEIQNYYEI